MSKSSGSSIVSSILCLVLSLTTTVGWSHGTHSHATASSQHIDQFLGQLAGRGIRIHFEKPKQEDLHSKSNSEVYEMDSAAWEAIDVMMQKWARDTEPGDVCMPPKFWDEVREFFVMRIQERFWIEMWGETKEFARRVGPVIAVMWAITEAIEPAHGALCPIIYAFFMTAGKEANYTWKALFDNKLLDTSILATIRDSWTQYTKRRQYRKAVRSVMGSSNGSARFSMRQGDYLKEMAEHDGPIGSAVGESFYWSRAWRQFWLEQDPSTAADPFSRGLDFGHIHSEAACEDGLCDSTPGNMGSKKPTLTGLARLPKARDEKIVTLDSAEMFRKTYRQITEGDTRDRRLQAVEELVQYFMLEKQVAVEMIWPVHALDVGLYNQMRSLIATQAKGMDRLEEILVMLTRSEYGADPRVMRVVLQEWSSLQAIFMELAAWAPHVKPYDEEADALKAMRDRLQRIQALDAKSAEIQGRLAQLRRARFDQLFSADFNALCTESLFGAGI